MNQLKIMLLAIYAIGIALIILVLVFFSMVNSNIEIDVERSSKTINNPELTTAFLEKVKSDRLTIQEYTQLFEANFEAERAAHAEKKAFVEFNESFQGLVVSLMVLQLLLVTVYIRQSRKS